jgi:alanine dehydrogenase
VPAAEASAQVAFRSAEEVDRALDYPSLIEALRAAFRAGSEVPVRHHHEVPRPGADPATLLLMPAWQPGTALGTKLVTISPGNEAHGLPAVQGVYLLLDGMTCRPRALLEGGALTVRRTACASALAADYLARDDSRHLVMVGAGALAPHLVRAHASVRPIRRVTIWNRTPAKAEALATALAAEGLEARTTEDLKAAVGDADVVSCATMSSEPVISGAWLRVGCHVDLVGAFRPSMREADDAAIRRSRVFVDTRSGALAEAGDIVLAIASGALAESGIQADLFDLCRGASPGRRDAKEITLFKSVGSALEDLAAARLVVDRTGA